MCIRDRSGEVRLLDLANIEDLICSGAKLGGIGNPLPIFQSVNSTEMIGNASVMTCKSNITIPAGGGLEVSRAFGQAFQTLVLIDFDFEVKRRDLESPQTAIRVVEPIRQGEVGRAVAGCNICLLYTSRCV